MQLNITLSTQDVETAITEYLKTQVTMATTVTVDEMDDGSFTIDVQATNTSVKKRTRKVKEEVETDLVLDLVDVAFKSETPQQDLFKVNPDTFFSE